jgi:hypothetical protein
MDGSSIETMFFLLEKNTVWGFEWAKDDKPDVYGEIGFKRKIPCCFMANHFQTR